METASLKGADIIVLACYLGCLLLLGAVLEKFVKRPEDMFAAGGKSPWWLSGISAYMTMFSSGTFVVWGGIAYLGGMAAVSICTTLGISALISGQFIAAKWKEAGVSSAAEFIRKRYGDSAVHTYTWLGMIVRILGSAVALYSIAVIVCALIHIPEAGADSSMWLKFFNWFRDDTSGTFSVSAAIVLIGIVILVISGNLWAVLVTDGLQFVVLTVSVIIVVPLLLNQDAIGGISGFIKVTADTPSLFIRSGKLVNNPGETMLSLASGPFTWIFLVGWIIIHSFKIGGEWSFVQRFLCVPDKKDAKKVGFMFGALYLASPLIWMLPPMIYRIMHPVTADMSATQAAHMAEKAYMLACASVLPAGLVGLLLAAMLSATVSMIDSEVNVYAGAVTRDIYAKLAKKEDDAKHLLKAGHVFTIIIGFIVIGAAVCIPYMGGAQNVILTITGLFVGPLVLPTIWGLFSKNVNLSAVYITIAVGAISSAILKFGLSGTEFVINHNRVIDVIVGIIPPVLTLLVLECLGKKKIQDSTSITAEREECL